MKKHSLSAVTAAVLAAAMLTACTQKQENTPVTIHEITAPSETETTPEETEETVPEETEALQTDVQTSAAEEETAAEISTENDELIRTVIDNEDYWTEAVKADSETGYGDLCFWFMDIDLDGTPEFVVGGAAYGNHGANGFDIFSLKDGKMELIKDSYGEGCIMFWGADETEDPDSPEKSGMNLFLCTDGTDYMWFAESCDHTANEFYYSIEKVSVESGVYTNPKLLSFTERYSEDGEISEYLYDPQWDEAATEYASSCTKDDFLTNYGSFFGNLKKCRVNIRTGRYINCDFEGNRNEIYGGLSEEEKISAIGESLSAWSYTITDDTYAPFGSVIEYMKNN